MQDTDALRALMQTGREQLLARHRRVVEAYDTETGNILSLFESLR